MKTKVKKETSKKTTKTAPKTRETVKIGNYQELAMRTCLKECRNEQYWGHGLLSEIGELIGKVEGAYAKHIRGDKTSITDVISSIKGELGDCFWFIALGCDLTAKREEKVKFESVFKESKSTCANMIISPFQGLSAINFEIDKEILVNWVGFIKSICAEFKIKPSACLEANIRKLSKRQAENKIRGNGDKR